MKFRFQHNNSSIRYHKNLETVYKIKKIASNFFGININEILLYYLDEDNSKIVLITEEDLKNLNLMEPDKEFYNIIIEDCTKALKNNIEHNYKILAKHFVKELENKYPQETIKTLLFRRELLEIKKYMKRKSISDYYIKKVLNSVKKNFKLIYINDKLNRNISIESFSNEINKKKIDIQTLSISFLENITNSVISSDQNSKSSSDFSKTNKFNHENENSNTDSIVINPQIFLKRKFSKSLNNNEIKISLKSENCILKNNFCNKNMKNKRRNSNLAKMTFYNNVKPIVEEKEKEKIIPKKQKNGYFIYNFIKKFIVGKK